MLPLSRQPVEESARAAPAVLRKGKAGAVRHGLDHLLGGHVVRGDPVLPDLRLKGLKASVNLLGGPGPATLPPGGQTLQEGLPAGVLNVVPVRILL